MKPMQCLSVRQPWAWLIVNGYKPLENRSRRTKYRGPFYVHASLRVDPAGYEWVKHHHPEIVMPPLHEMPRGGIVGVAEITAVALPNEPLQPEFQKWRMEGFGWILRNASSLPFRPMRGMLGFFPPEA